MTPDKDHDRFEVLRQLALAGSKGEALQETAQVALQQACMLIGLAAAAIYLWNDHQAVQMRVTHADTPETGESLAGLEESLFSGLRRDRHLVSAYLSFGGDQPFHSFTKPLQQGSRIFGAVIGLQRGAQSPIGEDIFLEAFSAALALNVAISSLGEAEAGKSDIEKERLSAVVETAVTVNHEINNPLTAILGNVQLLLLKREDLDDELKAKLRTIETAALKIRDVTQRLMKLKSPRSTDYADGTRMIDLSDDNTDADSEQS